MKSFLFINNWSHETCKITTFKENAWHSCYTSAIFILYVTSCRQSYACINEKMSHRVLDSVGHSWLIISCEIFATACIHLKNTQNKWSHILKRWKYKHRPKVFALFVKTKMRDFTLDFSNAILQLYYIVEKFITVPSQMYETTAVKFHIT